MSINTMLIESKVVWIYAYWIAFSYVSIKENTFVIKSKSSSLESIVPATNFISFGGTAFFC